AYSNFKRDITHARIKAGSVKMLSESATVGGGRNYVSLIVVDDQGQPFPNVAVKFSANNSASITPMAVSNNAGEISGFDVELTSDKSGVVTVTISLN
ncbi:Ig-like domain-containing protein, partial [Microcoleus sp. A2-C2]|uniref:Ig-like domain-containing protein n=1 Tax=Microcoleus sp. A2-C2 TaxID=2818530 RepID=UPI002FD17858